MDVLTQLSKALVHTSFIACVAFMALSLFGAPRGKPYNVWQWASIVAWVFCMAAIVCAWIVKAVITIFGR